MKSACMLFLLLSLSTAAFHASSKTIFQKLPRHRFLWFPWKNISDHTEYSLYTHATQKGAIVTRENNGCTILWLDDSPKFAFVSSAKQGAFVTRARKRHLRCRMRTLPNKSSVCVFPALTSQMVVIGTYQHGCISAASDWLNIAG